MGKGGTNVENYTFCPILKTNIEETVILYIKKNVEFTGTLRKIEERR